MLGWHLVFVTLYRVSIVSTTNPCFLPPITIPNAFLTTIIKDLAPPWSTHTWEALLFNFKLHWATTNYLNTTLHNSHIKATTRIINSTTKSTSQWAILASIDIHIFSYVLVCFLTLLLNKACFTHTHLHHPPPPIPNTHTQIVHTIYPPQLWLIILLSDLATWNHQKIIKRFSWKAVPIPIHIYHTRTHAFLSLPSWIILLTYPTLQHMMLPLITIANLLRISTYIQSTLQHKLNKSTQNIWQLQHIVSPIFLSFL
jgi:hypothetical protein